MSELKLISINTKGTKNKQENIIKEIKHYNVIMLQEQYLDNKGTILDKYRREQNTKIAYTTNNKNI